MFDCPTCHKVLKSKRSMERHQANFHSADPLAKQKAGTVDNASNNASNETLELETPPEQTFECGACNAKITRGQEKCPGCGEALDWSGI